MKIEHINIDTESLQSIKSELNHSFLLDIHERYIDSLDQIIVLLASPLTFMGLAIAKVKKDHISIKDAVEFGLFLKNPPSDPKDAAKQLYNFHLKRLKGAEELLLEEALEGSNRLYENYEEIKKCFDNIGLNALVNSWTLFEAFTKEIWITALNTNPNLVSNKIIRGKGDSEGKTIPLNLLSKYDFNLANHLGEILAYKYDFSGIDGIKKAFAELFNLTTQEIKCFENNAIGQLEISRHIIVHNAGIIDSRYLSRSKRDKEVLYSRLSLEVEEVSDMINASIYCLKDLLLITNSKA